MPHGEVVEQHRTYPVRLSRTLAFSLLGGLVVPLMTLLLAPDTSWRQLLGSTVFSTSYALSIGTLVHFVLHLIGPRIFRLSPAKAWAALVLNLVLCAVAGCLAGTAIGILVLQYPWHRLIPIAQSSVR